MTWAYCPRCGDQGDPHNCTCVRQLRGRIEEARDHLRAVRASLAMSELACATRLLDEMRAPVRGRRAA